MRVTESSGAMKYRDLVCAPGTTSMWSEREKRRSSRPSPGSAPGSAIAAAIKSETSMRSSARENAVFHAGVADVSIRRMQAVPWEALAGLAEAFVPAIARVLDGAAAGRE